MKKKEFRLNKIQHLFMLAVWGCILYTLLTIEPLVLAQSEWWLRPWRIVGYVMLPLGVYLKLNNDARAIRKIYKGYVAGKETLVTDGWYRLTRNPCYLGQQLTVLSFMLVFPSWAGIFAYVVFVIVANLVVRAEEERLEDLYGEQYQSYRKTVNRWLPGPTQLAVWWRTR